MCGPIAAILKKQFPLFTRREWIIYTVVIVAILAGNAVNLIFNVIKYEQAAKNPVTSVSQEALTDFFPAFTLGMCLRIIDSDYAGYVDTDGVEVIRADNSNLTVKYAPIDTEDEYDDCWLMEIPPLTLKVPKASKGGSKPVTTTGTDGFEVTATVTSTDPSNATLLLTSRILGIFVGFPPGTTAFPSDFDGSDFDNQFQIFIPGYYGSLPVSYKEAYTFSNPDTPIKSFPLSPFRTANDVPGGDTFVFKVDAKGVSRIKTVTKEDSTFGLGPLFAALISIMNLSLTVFAVIFPNKPLVVSQTYFALKKPKQWDPTKGPEQMQSAEEMQNGKEKGTNPKNEAAKAVKGEAAATAKEEGGDVALSFLGGGD